MELEEAITVQLEKIHDQLKINNKIEMLKLLLYPDSKLTLNVDDDKKFLIKIAKLIDEIFEEK